MNRPGSNIPHGQDGDQDTAFDFRARENSRVHLDDAYSEEALANEIPSTHRQGGKNKTATVLGFLFMALLAVLLVWYVNSRPDSSKPPPEREVRSQLPQFPDVALPAPPPLPGTREDTKADVDPYDAALKRRMAGNVISGGSGGRRSSGSNSASRAASNLDDRQNELARLAYLQQLGAAQQSGAEDMAAVASRGRLAGQLEPTVTEAVKAGVLPNRNFVLTKGSTLDCVLETAIDSTVPGITTCQLTRDIYSDNGKVLLLDRGTQLVGEYSGGLRAGQARMFMLWTRARTPNGVVVNIDSPATDELGRAGVDGHVDTFFWKRFGAAILMSVISDGIDASRDAGSNNYLNNTGRAGERVVDSMLQQHANIAPRLVKNQGTRIQVMVARDLDFSEVYALKFNRRQHYQ